MAVGLQWTGFALMLLFTHAIAKALLFMSLGSIILTTSSQDITEMGGLWSRMPATTSAFLVGSAGVVGLLPLGSFWALRQGLDDFGYGAPWLAAVLLAVNALTAVNLTRVFRLVFLGSTQAKTRRAPEVQWPMAVPMVSMIVVTLAVPLMMMHLSLLPDWTYINLPAVVLLCLSGLVGVGLGSSLTLNRTWARPVQVPLKLLQDLLAYDFYMDQVYLFTVVWFINLVSRFSAWFDRYVVDGMVNLVGLASILGGESLKYSVSGQSQFYLLTILMGVSIIGGLLTWLMWQ